MTSDKKLIYSIAEWLWENDTENLYIGFQSAYHWGNLAESAREHWYSKAELMLSFTGLEEVMEEAEAEIAFFKEQLVGAAEALRAADESAYRFTGPGRPPSPRERRIVREGLERRARRVS